MTSIDSEPTANHVAVDVNYYLFDAESDEVISAGDCAMGLAGAIWLIIVLTGITIGLLYATGVL